MEFTLKRIEKALRSAKGNMEAEGMLLCAETERETHLSLIKIRREREKANGETIQVCV